MRLIFTFLTLVFLSCYSGAQVPERYSHIAIFNDNGVRYTPATTLVHASVVFKSQSQKLIQQQSNQKIKVDSIVGAHKKLYFTYNISRQVITCVTKMYNYEEGRFRTAAKSEFNYDSFGNCMYEVVTEYSFTDSQLTDSLLTKTAYVYGEYGPLSITGYSYVNGGWEYNSRNDFNYKDGHLVEEIAYKWLFNQWDSFEKYEYRYTVNGLLKEVQSLVKVNDDWICAEKCESDYDRNLKLTTVVTSMNDTIKNRWMPIEKYNISYDSKGNIISEELEKRDSLNVEWVLTSKTMYGYLDINYKRGDIQNGDYVLGDFSSKHIMNQVQYAAYDVNDKGWSLSANDTKLFYSVVKLSAKQVLDESGYKIFK